MHCAFNIARDAGFFYHDAQQREKMVAAERRNVDEKVHKIIALRMITYLFF
jgi:hypothetical protein